MQDALGNTTQYSYDLIGNRAVITDANGEVTQHSYDALNRLITTTYAADGVTVSYNYDAAGNRTQMVDDVGTTTYQYDDFYRLITVTNPITGSVGYGYDDVGNRTQLIYPDSRSVTYTYDGDNRLVQVDDWNSGITGYQYDGAGRLITTTLPNGVVSANGYDDANRLTSLRHEGSGGSLLAEYLYQLDGAGNRVAVTETVRAPDVVQTIEAYVEQNGLLVLEAENGTATVSASHDWVTQTVQAGYEGTGYSRALPDIGARYEETETASSPQLSWPIYNETADTYSVWVRGMAPDAGGDSLHVGLDGGTPSAAADLTGFTDEWGWSRVTPSGDATLDLTATGEHTLDAWMREDGLRVDRVLLVTDTNYIPAGLGPAESPFEPITETIPGGLGTTGISYGYDALYRLTDAAYTGAITATFTYVYDSVGNMTAFTETVDAQTTGVTRTFDAANRLQTSFDATVGTTSYIYDANGNLTEVYPPGSDAQNPVGALRYNYDQRNLMVSHETNPDGTAWVLQAEYVYDGSNSRLQQVDYTGATPITTTYTNDVFGLTQVLVADDGTTQVYNLFGLDLISQDSGAEVRTLLVDGLGSVRLEMVGSVVETATTYTPYGEVLEQTGASGTVYGFTGEQEDGATGLLYLRARYYNSQLKTFMSRDPWEGTEAKPATLNYYVYVQGNPVNLTDVTGKKPFPEYCRSAYTKGGYAACVRDYYGVDPPADRFYTGTDVITGQPRCWKGEVAYRAAGYVEGLSLGGGTVLTLVAGNELVYDFASMERQEFFYTGQAWSTVVAGLVGTGYVGRVYGFRSWSDVESDYSGRSDFFYLGLGTSIATQGLAGIGVSTGVLTSHGNPDNSVGATAWYYSLNAGVTLPIDTGGGYAVYNSVESSGSYRKYVEGNIGMPRKVKKAQLINDILSGLPGIDRFDNPINVLVRNLFAVPMAQRYADIYDGIHYESYFPAASTPTG